MNEISGIQSNSASSIWIQNLVDGVAGIAIRAKHADFCGASPFQKIEVFDTYAFGRVLLLGGTIVLTEKDEHVYNEMITHPAMLMHPGPQSVCVIGGGDGGCLREALKHSPVASVHVVDIDAMVKETVLQYFPGLAAGFADPRTKVTVNDGFTFLDKSEETFDVIIVDSYDPGGPVASLETARFHRLVHAHLRDGGVAVFQTDSPTIRGDYVRELLNDIGPLFGECGYYLCTIPTFPESVCGFLLGAREKGTLGRFDEARWAGIGPTCKYYNRDVHCGAFKIPEHVRRIVGL
jgi:spermidine synthase